MIQYCSRDPDLFQPASGLYVALTEWGLSETETLKVVQAAVQSDLPGSEYSRITVLFTRARRGMISPQQTAQRVITELPGTGSIRKLEKRILQERKRQ